MYQQIKTEIKEIVEIVNQCPESLKLRCFEILLENFIKSETPSTKMYSQEKLEPKEESKEQLINNDMKVNNTVENEPYLNDDIEIKDFHVKVQKFLQTYNISTTILNHLYYKEDNKLMPFYETLKSTKMAECQIRLALLTAFENSYTDQNGEMSFNCELIRNRCQAMKCYNATNFASTFKIYKALWEDWPVKYDKTFNVTLSAEGKKELAKTLNNLAKGD